MILISSAILKSKNELVPQVLSYVRGVAGKDRRGVFRATQSRVVGVDASTASSTSMHGVIAVFHVTSKTFELLERYPGTMPCPTFFVINPWVEA